MSAKFPNTKPDGLEKPEPPGPPPPKQLYAHSPAAGGMAQPTIDYSPGPVEWEPEPPGSPPATYNDLVARPIIIGADTAYWRKATECAEGALKDLTQSAKAKIAELEAECNTMREVAEITEGALVASNETVRRLREENQRLASESGTYVTDSPAYRVLNAHFEQLKKEHQEALSLLQAAENDNSRLRGELVKATSGRAIALAQRDAIIGECRSAVQEAVAAIDDAYKSTGHIKVAVTSEQRLRLERLLEQADEAMENEAAERIDEQIREANGRWAERNT